MTGFGNYADQIQWASTKTKNSGGNLRQKRTIPESKPLHEVRRRHDFMRAESGGDPLAVSSSAAKERPRSIAISSVPTWWKSLRPCRRI
jgi:hypothetical protein